MLRLSTILDLIEESPASAPEIRRGYAENAENAVIPRSAPITAFRSFTAFTRAPALKEDAPARLVCFSCWGSDFWTGSGTTICRRCHPPAPGAEGPFPESSSSPAGSVPDAPSAPGLAGPDREGVFGGGAA